MAHHNHHCNISTVGRCIFIPYPETISAKVQMTNAHQDTIDIPYKYVNTIAK